MKLVVTNLETNQAIKEIEADDWLKAAQVVEAEKKKILGDSKSLSVSIVCKDTGVYCNYLLDSEFDNESFLTDSFRV